MKAFVFPGQGAQFVGNSTCCIPPFRYLRTLYG